MNILLRSCLLLLALVAGCSPSPDVVKLAGGTMGTTWNVTYVVPDGSPGEGEVLSGIESRLEAVNASMSTYRPDSEISRFNDTPVGEWLAVSAAFYEVLSTALALGRQAEGAYDVTVGPLVELWGFGPAQPVDSAPDAEAIAALRQHVGQHRLRLDGEARKVQKLADLRLDLSSLAKGYAVDQVALWLEEQGIDRFLVEVGGEMRLAGMSGRGDAWRVAIEQPDMGARSIAAAITLTDASVATSGDYRNFFEVDGMRYSHAIDPRTGYPVAHQLVSVTVVHPSAMLADGWATALTVLGPEAAQRVAEKQGLAVYFIERDGEEYAHSHTAAFQAYLPAEME